MKPTDNFNKLAYILSHLKTVRLNLLKKFTKKAVSTTPRQRPNSNVGHLRALLQGWQRQAAYAFAAAMAEDDSGGQVSRLEVAR